MSTGTVYALIDPRDDVTRYIGQTTRALPVRLAGHIASPAPNVAVWIAELKAVGHKPVIAPVHENVPADDLLRMERKEITRRLVQGEPLLNGTATADARKELERAENEERAARSRAAWKDAAHRTRASLGGPLPPGNIPDAPFPDTVWQHMPGLWQAEDTLEEAEASTGDRFDDDLWQLKNKVMDAGGRLQGQLWDAVWAGWASVRGRDQQLDKQLEATVKAAVGTRCASTQDATRLVTLTPWYLIAVRPWAALAKRAELSLDIDDFVRWVTDRPEVEDALRFLVRHRPHLLETLAEGEHYNNRLNPSVHLVAAAAAHAPFDLAPELTEIVTRALRDVARDQMLTPQMADLLARLDPRALDDVFGKDVAAAADAALGLPAGTAASVIGHLLEHSRSSYGVLDRAFARAAKKLPSTPYPDYSTWTGPGVALTQVVAESLYASGLVAGEDAPSTAEAAAAAQSLWACDLENIARYAGR